MRLTLNAIQTVHKSQDKNFFNVTWYIQVFFFNIGKVFLSVVTILITFTDVKVFLFRKLAQDSTILSAETETGQPNVPELSRGKATLSKRRLETSDRILLTRLASNSL